MAGRRHIPSSFEGRSIQAPGMMRHGPFPGSGPAGHRPREPLLPPERVETRVAVQLAEIERLDGENHRLAAAQVALRQELAASQQEVQKLRAHIRSIQTESDIQVRVLQDKIAKMEVDIRAGESVKKNLHEAHIEAQSLAAAVEELTAQTQLASKELDKAHADLKRLPETRVELDNLRKEHQRLRTTFEYEKGLNMQKVEELKAMEKHLVGMAREVERMRAEVSHAEKRASAPYPYGGPYMHPDHLYPPPMYASGGYTERYGRPHGQHGVGPAGDGMISYGGGGTSAASGGVGGAFVPTPGGASVRGEAYDAPLPQR